MSFHNFLPYFPYHFTFQLTFLPYFPYHFTIFFCIFQIFSLFNLFFFHIFDISSLFNLFFFFKPQRLKYQLLLGFLSTWRYENMFPYFFPVLEKKTFGHKKNKRVNISVNDTSVKDKDLSKLNMCLFYYK
jgi:hypothetical protein